MRIQKAYFGGKTKELWATPGSEARRPCTLPLSIHRHLESKILRKKTPADLLAPVGPGLAQTPPIRKKGARRRFGPTGIGLLLMGLLAGCASWTHTDRGALAGGLLGAGTGALIGSSSGHAGAGAALGAGLGTLAGTLFGSELDEVEAKNQAMIAQQLGRPVGPGAVGMEDVVAMTQAGVAEELIVNHIRANGVSRPLTTNDLILLQQQGISPRVIAAMQEAGQARPPAQAVHVVPAPPPAAVPVIVEEYHYGPWGPPHWWWHYPYCSPPRSRFSWGIAIGH